MKKKLLMLGLITLLGANAFAAENTEEYSKSEYMEMLKAENVTLKEKLANTVLIVEDGRAVEKINQGDQGEEWKISARTYIEREQYEMGTKDFGASENIIMFGTGINAVKGKWGYHLNIEQRGTGHLNSEGADNQNTRVDYKIRYQATPKIGVAFKYRSERGNKKRTAWAAEQNRNRDRVELGIDSSYEYVSGWFVVGHDVDSQLGAKNQGNYYEGDLGPTFQLTDNFALRPTLYSTGEFYNNNDETMYDHQVRLMGIYQVTDKLTIMPRIRYSIERDLSETSKTYDYTSDYRVRAELLAAYSINDQWSVDGGIAYDWQDREYDGGSNGKSTKNIDMFWYTMGVNYRF
jgi:opacity protein-like surface antigen